MRKNKLKWVLLVMIFTMSSPKISAQCHIKDVIMGTVPEDKDPDDERYFWTKRSDNAPVKAQKATEEVYAPRTLIIMFDGKKAKKTLAKVIKKKHCELLYDYKIISGMAIKLPESWKIEEAMAYFKQLKGVTNVTRDKIVQLH